MEVEFDLAWFSLDTSCSSISFLFISFLIGPRFRGPFFPGAIFLSGLFDRLGGLWYYGKTKAKRGRKEMTQRNKITAWLEKNPTQYYTATAISELLDIPLFTVRSEIRRLIDEDYLETGFVRLAAGCGGRTLIFRVGAGGAIGSARRR
jgi:hypothetical protein